MKATPFTPAGTGGADVSDFEKLGESRVRAEVARGGQAAFNGNSERRKAASEWLARREGQRIRQRGTPLRPTIVGPVVFMIVVACAIALVASI